MDKEITKSQRLMAGLGSDTQEVALGSSVRSHTSERQAVLPMLSNKGRLALVSANILLQVSQSFSYLLD